MSAQRKAQFQFCRLRRAKTTLAEIDWLEAKAENLMRLRRQLRYPCRCASKPIK